MLKFWLYQMLLTREYPYLLCLLCFLQLKDDAVALVDVFAPPDFILNSPIGNADGQVKIFCYTSVKALLPQEIFSWLGMEKISKRHYILNLYMI